jgi:hypothetical protein
LAKIVGNLDLIVSDAPSSLGAPVGLFGFGGFVYPPVAADAPRKSKLAESGGTVLTNFLRDELEEILPGVSDLGANRKERLIALRTRLMELHAWAWVQLQPGFISAQKTAEYLASRKQVAYQSDVNDFRLLDAFALPLMFLRLGAAYAFPSRAEVEGARNRAQELLQFFDASSGLFRQGRISYQAKRAVERLHAELAALSRAGYKKPRDTDPVPEVQFAYEVCDGLVRVFSEVSKTILGSILAIGEFTPDDARIRRLIAESEARRGSK